MSDIISEPASVKCIPCSSMNEEHRLSPADIEQRLANMPLWSLNEKGHLVRIFSAKNFQAALDFLNLVGATAESLFHHPDLHLTGYKNVEITLYTHKLNGVTAADFSLAEAIDKISVSYSLQWKRENPDKVEYTSRVIAQAPLADNDSPVMKRRAIELIPGAGTSIPVGVDKFYSRMKGFISPESISNGLSFIPRSSDIFITTYPKCGTTWVSFIAHSLRTRGDLNFGEITEVVPWTILAKDCNQDLNAEQVAFPRLFKSHESYDLVPKGGKYIYVTRHPEDVCVSFHTFSLSLSHLKVDELNLDDYCKHIFLSHDANTAGTIWDHYLSFYSRKSDSNILWLFYEDLLENTEREIRRISSFMDISLDEELKEIVLEQAKFSFMKNIESKFDDHFVYDFRKESIGLDVHAKMAVGKVNKGDDLSTKLVLSEEMRLLINDKWTKEVFPKTGFSSYEQMREAFNRQRS